MKLSNKQKLIIAKSNIENNKWLPLWMHAQDTVKMISFLLHARYAYLPLQCEMSFEEFKKTAILLAYLHDIGKITPLFQSKILGVLSERRSLFEYNGINNICDNFIDKNKSHHSKCGEVILLHLGFPKDFSSIVGAHHGMPADNVKHHIENYPEHFWGNPQNIELWYGLYNEWANFSLENSGFSKLEIPKLSKKALVLLSGLLITADWLASNQTLFSLLDEDEFLSEDEYPIGRFENAINKINFPDVWEPFNQRLLDDDFKERFGFSMNEIQRAVIETAENCDAPGLFILEAPMGIGKTEAALAASEILAARCDKTGLFFGLPTQATANGIFERVEKWAEQQLNDTFCSINLAHGSADFQPDFANLKCNHSTQTDFDGESGLVVHSFFSGGKKSLMADFVIGTVDRLLMAALKKKHAMLLHLGLSQKVVIVDECHAYDAYMNKYLDVALAWLHAYNVPVILLSATLPPDRKSAIIRAYLNNKSCEINIENAAYPRLTYTNGTEVRATSISYQSMSNNVEIVKCGDEIVCEEIERAVRSGACVGIICNTVLRAQHFANIARENSSANVILYHAQFIIPDRIEKEEKIKNAVGKRSSLKKRSGTIVVGTQVLEQSLDIDFDILITDLCPMDLLLQRIGRLHRHVRIDRPNGYKTAKCIVLGTFDFEKASENIYTKWLLMRTNKLLPEKIMVPDDIDYLVCKTYEKIEPENAEEKIALEKYEYLIKEKEHRATAFVLSFPKESPRGNDMHGWLNKDVCDNDSSATAAVRDGISSIEVIVLVKKSDGSMQLLPWHSSGKKFFANVCPDMDDCIKIGQQKLRLPSRFCRFHNYERTIQALEEMDKNLTGFQKSYMLKGELVLLLDENLTASLCEFKLKYSQENGLTYEKEE